MLVNVLNWTIVNIRQFRLMAFLNVIYFSEVIVKVYLLTIIILILLIIVIFMLINIIVISVVLIFL
jgi:hypothetical protein